MALRFRNRNQAPPNGWLFEQAQTGWKNWIIAPSSQWDFRLLCRELQQFRRGNPRFGLSTEMNDIEREVEMANAIRVSQIPGAADVYLVSDVAFTAPKTQAPPSVPLSQRLQAVAEGLKRVNAGRIMLLDWENAGYPQVSQEVANKRAETCIACPKNGKGDFTRWFTVPASERIKKQIERLNEVKLSTPYDEQLGVCEICLCPLRLKMHTPIEHIGKYLSNEIKTELAGVGNCWVMKELG